MCVTTINDKRHHDFERETRGGKWKRVWREERKDNEIMMSKSKRN